ncbi:MAG: hypothetical protein [Wendovervirus sonii]|uniref:Uncharacterized protein n=1 Tax=phage Lak_Megaphage_Sonny TaxID=3109229 RepID=A0ABZ0Z2A8_9CAUD|nr:MAG: hypothetical protein [phage Lak_Megaphage_Sonny]
MKEIELNKYIQLCKDKMYDIAKVPGTLLVTKNKYIQISDERSDERFNNYLTKAQIEVSSKLLKTINGLICLYERNFYQRHTSIRKYKKYAKKTGVLNVNEIVRLIKTGKLKNFQKISEIRFKKMK